MKIIWASLCKDVKEHYDLILFIYDFLNYGGIYDTQITKFKNLKNKHPQQAGGKKKRSLKISKKKYSKKKYSKRRKKQKGGKIKSKRKFNKITKRKKS